MIDSPLQRPRALEADTETKNGQQSGFLEKSWVVQEKDNEGQEGLCWEHRTGRFLSRKHSVIALTVTTPLEFFVSKERIAT